MQRRHANRAACGLAIQATGLAGALIARALQALQDQQYGDGILMRELSELQQRLDRRQTRLAKGRRKGDVHEARFQTAFRQERAAYAVLFALGPDALVAATQCLYEASFAVKDPGLFLSVVLPALQG